MTEIQSTADFNSPPATPMVDFKAARMILHDDDLQNIYATLTRGDGALAKRRDLGELHKRLVTMVTTINQGLGEATATKAAEDRAQIDQRLDRMERAVNSMEGALRIELEPMLRTLVSDAVSASSTKRHGRIFPVVLASVVFFAGAGLGVVFQEQILSAGAQFLPASMIQTIP